MQLFHHEFDGSVERLQSGVSAVAAADRLSADVVRRPPRPRLHHRQHDHSRSESVLGRRGADRLQAGDVCAGGRRAAVFRRPDGVREAGDDDLRRSGGQ